MLSSKKIKFLDENHLAVQNFTLIFQSSFHATKT